MKIINKIKNWYKRTKREWQSFNAWYDLNHEQELREELRNMEKARARGSIYPPMN